MKPKIRDAFWTGLIIGFSLGLLLGLAITNLSSFSSKAGSEPQIGAAGTSFCSGGLDFTPSDPPTIYRVTAYCPCERCCEQFADGITSSGHIIKEDDMFVAAPPSFAFGTMLDIPGYGIVPVLDRGGAIKGKRLDVFFSTHQEALNWGVRYIKVRF